jgi:putative oxidoreductase
VLPRDPVTVVRANAAVQVGAAALLSIGILPRLCAMTLAASLLPTTLGGHRFWELDDPAARTQQRIHFFKNCAIIGALLLAAFD